MDDGDGYLMSGAATDLEGERLRHLQVGGDPFTFRHLEQTGVGEGWRCLEVGAGGGSVARWLGERVGSTGSVLATDLEVGRLQGLPASVEVRRHDIAHDDLDVGAYDLVHCRFLLQHLADSAVVLRRMAAALAPGGWLVVEEGDLGLFELSGAPDSARASEVIHELFKRWRAAGVIDAVLGRRLPGLVGALGLDDIGVDVMTPTGGQGDSAYEVFRLAWPSTRAAAAASGIAEVDLQCVDEGFANSTMVVGMTTFAVWGRAVS